MSSEKEISSVLSPASPLFSAEPASASSPLILVVSGPSGSGKSTLVQRILELPGTMASISCTTRSRRTTESSGKCYDFVTEAQFDEMVQRGEFLEYARVFGKHSYGTPKKWLEESRRKNLDLVLEIDVQGALQVKEKLPEAVAIFILPPSREELERRLKSRGQDAQEEIDRRLAKARGEIAAYQAYDFCVVNEDVALAGREAQAIVTALRCTTARRQARVEKLLASFGG
jgi:guanylate kinase